MAAIPDQENQGVKSLRCENDRFPVTRQLALGRFQAEGTELVELSRTVIESPCRRKRRFAGAL
jgi:hypothetical protein